MGTLSDIAAKFKSTLGSIKTGVEDSVRSGANAMGITKESIKDFASDPLVQKAVQPGLSGLAGMGELTNRYLIDRPAEVIGGIAPIVSDLADDFTLNNSRSTATSQGVGVDLGDTISNTISGAGRAVNMPANVLSGAEGVTNSYSEYSNAIQSGDYNKAARSFADTIIGSVGTVMSGIPAMQMIKAVTGGVMGGTGADKALAGSKDKATDYIGNIGAEFGLDKNSTKEWANTTINGLSTAMQLIAGVKYNPLSKAQVATRLGIVDPLKVTASQIVTENVKNALKGAAVGSSVDQLVLLFDDGSGKDKAINSAASLITSSLMPGAFGGAKGKPMSKKGSLSKIAEENKAQTSMDVTPKVEAPVVPKGVDEIVADYVPVEKASLESSLVVPSSNKLLSDLAKETDTALAPTKDTADGVIKVETPEETIARYKTEKENFVPEPISQFETPEQTIARNIVEGRVSPIKQEQSTGPEMKTEGAPNIEPEGGNKPPTIYDTALTNIMSSFKMGPDVFVSKSKSGVSKLGSIGGYLEKGMTKVKDQVVNLRNITESARHSAPIFANKILELAGVDKSNLDLGRKFDLKESDFVGGITPNEKTPITSYSQVAGAVRTSIPDSIKNFIGKENVERTKNLVDAESVYMVNKDNKEKLDTLFTPEEQARFAASEELSKSVPKEMESFLLANDLIKDKQLANDYVRFVQSEYGRKILSEPVLVDINGKQYKFDNMESAMNSAQARRFSGDPKISDSMESQLASHLKAKGENLDLLRVHSPTIQLISYAQSIGNMLQNKAVIDNFREFMAKTADKKIKNPEAFDFVAKLFPEQGQSEILNNLIGVYGRENTTTGKVKEAIAETTRKSSAAILAGNLHTLIQPLYSTIPKGLMLKAANRYSEFGHPVDTLDGNKTVTDEILSANGFISPMEQFDTSKGSAAGKLLSEIAAESSGRTPEQAVKKLYVLADMAATLKKNGVTDLSSKPSEIAQAWEKWARDPKNKDQYMIEQDRIHENLSWMGESTIMNKSMIDIIRKTNLQALQGYTNSQVNKAMTDFGRMIGNTEASGDQKKAAVARTVAGIIPYAVTLGGVYSYLQAENPEADPTELFWLAMGGANKMSGNVFSQAYGLLSGQTSSPITVLIPLMTDIFGMGVSAVSQDGTFLQRTDKFITDLSKSIGGLTSLNELTGGAFRESISDMLGTANTSDLTRTGKARGTKINSMKEGLERVVGLNTDTLIQNYMYGKVSDAEFAKKMGIEDPALNFILTNTIGKVAGIRDGLLRPITDFVNGITGETDKIDYGLLTNINTVYGKITPEDTTETVLMKLGVSKDLAPIVNSEIQKLVEAEAGNTTGLGTANKFGGIVSETPGYTKVDVNNVGKKLELIRTENPKLFNDIIASFGRLYKSSSEGGIPVDMRNIDILKKDIFKNSSMQDDAAISAVSGDNPNSTALSQTITNAYQDISKDDTTLEQKVKSLKVLDGIFGGVYNAGTLGQGIERSIALSSFDLLTALKNEMKYTGLKGVQDILKSTPNILKAIRNGLTYRGFNTIPQGTTTGQPASEQPKTAGSLSAIASSMFGQKNPKWKNLEYDERKIDPLIKTTRPTTLSEIMRSQSQKSSMSKSKIKK